MKIQWKWFAYLWLLNLVSLPISAASLKGSTLNIATWNIEWLTTNPSHSIKESKRDSQDFSVLSGKFRQISPDILAFQEVDSIEAIQKVVGDDYQIYLSDRAKPQYANLQFNDLNQYTGFAVSKKWLKENQATIIDPKDISLLPNSKLRFATYIVLKQPNQADMHLLSVHLKSGCPTKKKRSRSCRQLSEQADQLNQWLTTRVSNQDSFIVMGDFNHNLSYKGDWMWQQLTNGLNNQAKLATQTTPAICQVKSNRNPNKLYRYPSLIDHIIVSQANHPQGTQQVVFTEQEALNYHLSDHCPVVSKIQR
ncbi:endonuclease/exonuclease/phosphatase family protein [Vibrio sp. CK2-1]|uniref:endonuclease/exonuclease/phosphatase family protein n=1 Tax=Vibrio sp. CK2-1 TaxID=2912249 RepID=UPI001F3FC5B6|nr:endonuclease/exonuclease/phosphatase family protein [Vibrio sp. CK2-1]MCF7353447.1 endonuclease/exonuclease/phosphatase family protein [Vibrio sp. CK2-1]